MSWADNRALKKAAKSASDVGVAHTGGDRIQGPGNPKLSLSAVGGFLKDGLFTDEPTVSDQTSYADLMTGRRFNLSYETQTGKILESGDPLVRKFSPFVIQYVPPDDAAFYMGDLFKGDKKVNVNVITDAWKTMTTNAVGTTFPVDARVQAMLATTSEDITYQQTHEGKTLTAYVGAAQALSYASQLYQLIKMPPLQFLINPLSMSVTYTKVQDYSERTRKNRAFKSWGEEQPKISFSAKTGGFIASPSSKESSTIGQAFVSIWTANTESSDGTPSGMQYASKRYSAAWQNFLKMLHMYQNASLIYDKLHETEAHLGVGSFAVSYDQMVYFGHIEQFDFSYQQDTPHSLEFNFDFTVTKMLDLCTTTGQPQRISEISGAYNKKSSLGNTGVKGKK